MARRFTPAYQNYLKSPRWQEKRQKALIYYGRRCQVCGSTTRLEVNHLSYANLFNEPMADLSILCHGCHVGYTRLRRTMSKKQFSGSDIILLMKRQRQRKTK